MSKWNKINELRGHIQKSDTLDTCAKYMKCHGYAPNIDCVSWIFTYKGVLVALYDLGNGHYEFNSAVTVFDLLIAKIHRCTGWFSRKIHSTL